MRGKVWQGGSCAQPADSCRTRLACGCGCESLAKEWRNALVARLLHPGAETAQIIEVYINTIKVSPLDI